MQYKKKWEKSELRVEEEPGQTVKNVAGVQRTASQKHEIHKIGEMYRKNFLVKTLRVDGDRKGEGSVYAHR